MADYLQTPSVCKTGLSMEHLAQLRKAIRESLDAEAESSVQGPSARPAPGSDLSERQGSGIHAFTRGRSMRSA